MQEKDFCPLCGYKKIEKKVSHEPMSVMYNCTVCGRFELSYEKNGKIIDKIDLDLNKLAFYLFYNGIKIEKNKFDNRYITTMDKEKCDALLHEYERGDQTNKYPIHVDMEDIDIWYPYKFSDKIDYCLLYLSTISKHIGSIIEMPLEAVESCLFVDRYEETTQGREPRDEEGILMQTRYMLEYLEKSGYIEGSFSNNVSRFRLTPNAYERVDDLQKNSKDSRNVLVAMEFGTETNPLREAIREGIKKAKYTPIFIDEVQHNDLITPELLKYIHQSKFVVVDLTHRNNGAYFEEGYAMGLNKPVIQLCKCSEIQNLHFDIAQKNTIGWEKENDIPELLMKRINATIE